MFWPVLPDQRSWVPDVAAEAPRLLGVCIDTHSTDDSVVEEVNILFIFIYPFIYLFLLYRAVPAAYGSSQARG